MGSSASQKPSSKLERIVNIAIVIVAVFCLIGIVRLSLQWVRRPTQRVPLKVGQRLAIAGVDWSNKPQTLVLALSTNCKYCSESAPLYQQITKELATRPDIRIMAVLPQPNDQARQYLAGLSVPISEIRQSDLAALGIEGTPTIMLTDQSGTVTDLWVGKLMGKSEPEFLERLGLRQNTPHSEITVADLREAKKSKDVVVVDIENRDLFKLNHVDDAVNIPLDELDARAPNELATTNTVIVYCHICESDGESELARDILLRNGFSHVSILKGGLKSWESETPQKPPAGQPPDSVKKKAAGSTR